MSAAAVMAIVLLLFFLAGVTVGVLTVVAMSARRAHKAVRAVEPPPRTWPYISGREPDDNGPDEPPWWHARSGGD
jgi:hypothetical protein